MKSSLPNELDRTKPNTKEKAEENSAEMRELVLIKRKSLADRPVLDNKEKQDCIERIDNQIQLYGEFETWFQINRGDVFFVNFDDYSVGNEIKGPHFCAALVSSRVKNQMVTVVPLCSEKAGKEINPASEILIGMIPGTRNGKRTIALINQARTIDKRRLFNKEQIKSFLRHKEACEIKENAKITAQHIFIYRLSNSQYRKIHKAVLQYFNNGYIEH